MTIQDCLEYCLKQNGLDYCKNCGLNIEMLNKALAEERTRVGEIVEQIIQEERFSGTPYSMNRLLSFLNNPLTDKEKDL